MRAALVATFALFLPVPAHLGCACGLLDADAGVQLHVDVHGQPGHYRVEVTANGETLALAYDITAAGANAKCLGDCTLQGLALVMQDRTSNAEPILHAVVGSYDSHDQPTRLAVRVFRDDAQLVDAEVVPKYKDVEVNGPGCGVDEVADATVTTP